MTEPSATAPAILDEVAALATGQGARVLERGADRMVINTAWFLSSRGPTPSALFLVDRGNLVLQPGPTGLLLQYELSTRRMAMVYLSLTAALGLLIATISVPWGVATCLVVWMWSFGWSFATQRIRAGILFSGLIAKKPLAGSSSD